MLDLTKQAHRRFNPLSREWVLVSPHRTERPWQGQLEETAAETLPHYDSQCYLCPGNTRAGGVQNPNYKSTFVFENDFAALKPDTPKVTIDKKELIIAIGEPGICRVICFSPRHDLTISKMEIADLLNVVDSWVAQYIELGALTNINSVQIFENRGAMMGASNPHPHGQIWANLSLPNEMLKESSALADYSKTHNSCMLCDYLSLENDEAERLVCRNQDFVALVPFWAVWPFEVLVLAQRHVSGMDQLTQPERTNLADILKQLTTRYDRVFNVSFPYTMGFHQRPTDGQPHEESHLHCHFYPPLLRSATVRKFMVGYEMLAMPQRDITPEMAAHRLRSLG